MAWPGLALTVLAYALSGSETKSCARLNATDVLRMDLDTRAAAFSEPVVITGLLDNWTVAMDEWIGVFEFDGAHPDDPADEPRREAREAMLQIFKDLYGVPELFRRSERLRLSLHGEPGMGVAFCNHGFSWMGLVVGTKKWWFVPPSSVTTRFDWPSSAQCRVSWHSERERAEGELVEVVRAPSEFACELVRHALELVVVPTGP